MIVPRRPLLLFRLYFVRVFLFAACLGFAGCDRIPALIENKDRSRDAAEQKQAAGDYKGALASYEKSIDGTTKTADSHFRMALIYDEKLNDTLSAVYHFRRYLALQPEGNHARDAKNNLARLELTLATSLSGGTMISHAEALKLKNENTDLRKQVAAYSSLSIASNSNPTSAVSAGKLTAAGVRGGQKVVDKKLAPGARTYQVQPGDTFASISRKFYKNKTRAQDIHDANMNAVPSANKLKPGMTIIIP